LLTRQVSVFLENRSGRLADVCELLGENDIDIIAISISDTTDFGILRLILDRPQAAEELLSEERYTVSSTEVFAVRVQDKPGGLSRVLKLLSAEGIDVEYMYAVGKETRAAIIIMKVGHPRKTIQLLEGKDVELVDEAYLHRL